MRENSHQVTSTHNFHVQGHITDRAGYVIQFLCSHPRQVSNSKIRDELLPVAATMSFCSKAVLGATELHRISP